MTVLADSLCFKLRFRHRVSVISPTGRLIGYGGAALIVPLLESGRAVVERMSDSRQVSAVRLIEHVAVALNALGLRPGSFGVREVQAESGRCYYEHRRAWHEVVEG